MYLTFYSVHWKFRLGSAHQFLLSLLGFLCICGQLRVSLLISAGLPRMPGE